MSLKRWATSDELGMAPKKKFFSARAYTDLSYGAASRSAYERDKQSIMLGRAFGRLQYKTQIFTVDKERDGSRPTHSRNRLTHSLIVEAIATELGKHFELNVPLISAIALGHDIGHCPFGHAGERALNAMFDCYFSLGRFEKAYFENSYQGKRLNFFKHNHHSLRVAEYLGRQYLCMNPVARKVPKDRSLRGLNLSIAVREGMLRHTSISPDLLSVYAEYNDWIRGENHNSLLHIFDDLQERKCSFTLEGQVVDIADEIAQVFHDLEDGLGNESIAYSNITETSLYKDAVQSYRAASQSSKHRSTKRDTSEIRLNRMTYDRGNIGKPELDIFENVRGRAICSFIKNYLVAMVKRNVTETFHRHRRRKGATAEIVMRPEAGPKVSRKVFATRMIDFDSKTSGLLSELRSEVIKRDIWGDEKVLEQDRRSANTVRDLFKMYAERPGTLPRLRKAEYRRLKNDWGGLTAMKYLTIVDRIQGMEDEYAKDQLRKLSKSHYR